MFKSNLLCGVSGRGRSLRGPRPASNPRMGHERPRTARILRILAAASLLIAAGQATLSAAVPVGTQLGFTLYNSTPRSGYYAQDGTHTLANTWQEGANSASNPTEGPAYPISGGHVPASTYPITIDSYNGSSITPVTQVAFCIELEEEISFDQSYTHTVTTLSEVAPSSGSVTGKGAGISSTGIGDYKATLVQILFDQHYTASGGTDPTAWSHINAAAFQLSLWKLTHEAEVTRNGGPALSKETLYLGTASDTTTAHFGYYRDPDKETAEPYATAQRWVADAINAYDVNYESVLSLMPLTNESPGFSGGVQDLITVSLVPEPQEWALGCGLGLFALVGVRRWRRSRATA